jgi:class 3 adenylate cyclase
MPDPGRPTETRTIMMTDVAGSTALRSERGDLVADEILRIQAAVVRDQLRRHGGEERQFLGDGFLLFFLSPLAALDCGSASMSARSPGGSESCTGRRCTRRPA